MTLNPGYLAFGSRANETRAFIDHFCALRHELRRARDGARSSKADGLPAGRFGIIPDPDGIGLQLLGVPGGLANSTEPAGASSKASRSCGRAGSRTSCATSTDLERSAEFYRRFFGAEAPEDGRRASRFAPRTRAGSCAGAGRRGAAHRSLRRQGRALRRDGRDARARGARRAIVTAAPERAALPLPRRAQHRAEAGRSGADLGARMRPYLTADICPGARCCAARAHARAAAARVDAAGRHGASAATPRARLACIYVPHGAVMRQWTPAATARVSSSRRSCARSSRFAIGMNVVSGLTLPLAYGEDASAGANHTRSSQSG